MTLTDLSNLALDLIGEKTITNIDDSTALARICKRWSNMIYDEIITNGQFSYTIKETTLTTTADDANAFILPSDFVGINVIQGNKADSYYVANGLLMCYDKLGVDETLKLSYFSGDTTLLSRAPTWVISAIYMAIASRIALPITKDSALATRLIEDATSAFNQACFMDDRNKKPKRSRKIKGSRWTRGRY